ncbi:hypothetical protein CsSME_00028411 [Camellia sinensis var. sinensis]
MGLVMANCCVLLDYTTFMYYGYVLEQKDIEELGDSEAGGDVEVRGFRDGDGDGGFHGLDGHGGAEEEVGGDVVEGGEDESGEVTDSICNLK